MNGIAAWAAQLEWGVLWELLISAAAAVLCITFHETCHGLAALALGDPTARRAGRLSLNPLKHIDILGLAMLIVARFGWAKPVPINPRYFKSPKLGMAATALAGPVGNLLLAALASALYGASLFCLYMTEAMWLEYVVIFFQTVVYLSVGLAVFNLLPIPPLDGSKVLFAILPEQWYWKLMRYERCGMIVMVVLLMTDALDAPLYLMRGWVLSLMEPIASGAAHLIQSLYF